MTTDELILHWRFRVHRVQLAHYNSARKFGNLHLWLGIPAIVLSTVVGTTVFATLAQSAKSAKQEWIQVIVGMLSVLSAVLVALQTFLRYSELAEKHRVAGARFANLKHRIELLATLPPSDEQKLRESLLEIETLWEKLREESPNIPADAWNHVEQTLTYEEHEKRYPLSPKKTLGA
ncbi:MAG: SLATT domain-containing protein [Candidatus Sulfotelmatobacter sp.]|jgi:conflict system pore-forming effector with SLATT domain